MLRPRCALSKVNSSSGDTNCRPQTVGEQATDKMSTHARKSISLTLLFSSPNLCTTSCGLSKMSTNTPKSSDSRKTKQNNLLQNTYTCAQKQYFQWNTGNYGLPPSSIGKDSACSTEDPGSIPGLGRSPREGNG